MLSSPEQLVRSRLATKTVLRAEPGSSHGVAWPDLFVHNVSMLEHWGTSANQKMRFSC